MNDDDLFDLDEGPPLLEKMEMNQEPVLQSEDVRMPTAHETSRCPAASSSEAFKPVTAHDSLTGTPGYETSPGMFRQADPTPLPRAFHEAPAPAPAPYVQSPGFYPEAVYSMVAPVTPGVPMDVTPYTPQILRPRYPHDPHTKLRRAVQRNDRETLIQALHEGGGAKPCKAGKTAMHYAADAGNVEFMSILLQSGLNPQATSNAGHTLVDEAEYWVVKASLNGNREMMENCRQCRNIVAVFGGRRGYHKDVVSQRLALERSCHAQGRGEKFPWEDDLDYIAKRYEEAILGGNPWWKPEAITWSMDRDVPPLSDHDLPQPSDDSASPERVYEAPTQQPRPASLWTRAQRAASVPAAAPAASASSQAAPQDPQVSAAPAERQVSQGSSLRSLEDLLPTKFETMEEFVRATKFARDLILELQEFPADLYIKKRPVPPLNPNDLTVNI